MDEPLDITPIQWTLEDLGFIEAQKDSPEIDPVAFAGAFSLSPIQIAMRELAEIDAQETYVAALMKANAPERLGD